MPSNQDIAPIIHPPPPPTPLRPAQLRIPLSLAPLPEVLFLFYLLNKTITIFSLSPKSRQMTCLSTIFLPKSEGSG